ncbi:COMM domain-containing protein 7 [Chamberlinius hualienensis]
MPETVLNIEYDKIKNEVFEEIVDLSFQCIVETTKGQHLVSKTEDLANKCNLDSKIVKHVIKQLVQIISDGTGQSWTRSQFLTELEKLGLDSEKCEIFSKKWEEKQVDVSRNILSHTLANNRLVDMEWKFGVTAASSECNKIGSTFLQLKLVINKGDRLENVHMELTLPQFYAFMHEMERAKASMEFFG